MLVVAMTEITLIRMTPSLKGIKAITIQEGTLITSMVAILATTMTMVAVLAIPETTTIMVAISSPVNYVARLAMEPKRTELYPIFSKETPPTIFAVNIVARTTTLLIDASFSLAFPISNNNINLIKLLPCFLLLHIGMRKNAH